MLDCEPQLGRYSSSLPSASYGIEEKNGQRATTDSRAAVWSSFLAHPLLLTPTPMLFSHFCHASLCVAEWWTVCWTQIKNNTEKEKSHISSPFWFCIPLQTAIFRNAGIAWHLEEVAKQELLKMGYDEKHFKSALKLMSPYNIYSNPLICWAEWMKRCVM